MTELANQFREFKPSLRDSSIKSYVLNINKMLRHGVDLTDIDSIKDYLKDYKKTTVKNYASSLVIYSKMNKEPSEFVEQLEKMRDDAHKEYEDMVDKNEKTEKQKQNWIPYDEIVELKEKLYEEAMDITKKNKGVELTPKQRQKVQDALMLAIYTHMPLRNDVADMKVLSVAESKNISPEWKRNKNFLVMKPSAPYFQLNHYKTSDAYGTKELPVDERVVPLLKQWMRYNKTGYLFNNSHGTPLSSNGISKAFIRLFQEHKGKNVSTSMLRHIYLSDKYAPLQEEKKKDAEMMMHSTMMQNGYVKKAD
jgi:integrase